MAFCYWVFNVNIALTEDKISVFHGLIKIPLKVNTETKCQGKVSEVKLIKEEDILL